MENFVFALLHTGFAGELRLPRAVFLYSSSVRMYCCEEYTLPSRTRALIFSQSRR